MTPIRDLGGWEPSQRITPLADGAIIDLFRRDKLVQSVRRGPNEVWAYIVRPDGSIEDLGVAINLMTNAGRDLFHAAEGATGFGVSGTIATATSATSLTATATPFVASAYVGWMVVAEESTNAPVWANIGSNTTSALTVDSWKTGDDTAGTTPGSTANYLILPGARGRYMGVTADTGAAAAGNTTLTSEITNNGLARAATTYAHTGGTSTSTRSKTFSVSGGPQTVHRIGLFTAANTTAAGVMCYEVVLNSDAIVGNGDTLAITWTLTLS